MGPQTSGKTLSAVSKRYNKPVCHGFTNISKNIAVSKRHKAVCHGDTNIWKETLVCVVQVLEACDNLVTEAAVQIAAAHTKLCI